MTEEEEEQANETKRGAQGDINIIINSLLLK